MNEKMDEKLKEALTQALAEGSMTINEVREKMGLEPIEYGDVSLNPAHVKEYMKTFE
jgi:hypothetical protein